MKKILLLTFSTLLLTACAEKNEFKQAVFEQMLHDSDVKDYQLDPETMTRCVVDKTGSVMPGLLPFEDKNKQYYTGMTLLLTLSSSKNPQQTFKKAKSYFESPAAVMHAKMNYSQNVMECMSTLISEKDPT